jgi:preprotein translocase subunit SecE
LTHIGEEDESVTQTQTGDTPGERAERGAPARTRGQGSRRGVFSRLVLFLRQVVAELKKVVRPTRHELITYTSVVLVFVLAVMLYVSGLDFAFGKLVLWAFGGE